MAVGRPTAAAGSRPIVGDAGIAVAPRRALQRTRSRQSKPPRASHRGASCSGRTHRFGDSFADRNRRRHRDRARCIRTPAQCCRRGLKMAAFIGLFRRDLRLALRQGSDTGLVLGFFVLAIVLFPLGVGPEPAVLQRIGAGVVWVAALLAALLSLDRLFQSDYQDGGLEILALSR